jgi:pilus assembly protein TadC
MVKVKNMLSKNSRFLKGLLTFVAAFLTFIGPTYMVLILQKLSVPIPYSLLIGLVLFIAGILLFMRVFESQKT